MPRRPRAPSPDPTGCAGRPTDSTGSRGSLRHQPAPAAVATTVRSIGEGAAGAPRQCTHGASAPALQAMSASRHDRSPTHRRSVPLIGTTGKFGSGAGGHVGGEDVVGVSVEVLAGAVVAHGGAWVDVPGGDLYVAQVDADVEHGGDEGVPEHVWVHPRQLDAGLFGDPAEPAGGAVPVHPGGPAGQEDGSGGPFVDGPLDGAADGRGSGTSTTLSPLPRTRRTPWPCSSPRSSMLLPVASKVRRLRSPSIMTSAKSLRLVEVLAAVSSASNCRWVSSRTGDSAGTLGRRT